MATASIELTNEPVSERSAASSRRWGVIAAAMAGSMGAFWLALWLSGSQASVAMASTRCKANSALALSLLGLGFILLHAPSLRRRRWAVPLLAAAALLGAATLVEYVASVDLGIDQWLAHDAFSEDARFPNRMAPSAAASFMLLGASAWLFTRRARLAITLGQVCAFLVLAVSSAALVGYLYAASILYRPLPFLRLSPYTAAALIALVLSALALRPDVGLTRVFARNSTGGFLARRLVPITMLLPIAAGWLLLDERESVLLSSADRHALLVTTIALVMLPTVLFLSLFLDRVEHKRREAEEFLRRASELTSALSLARSVGEVVEATMDKGLAALGASAGAFLLLDDEGRRLRAVATRGYTSEAVESFREFSIDAPLPAARAVRERRAVFLSSVRDRDRSYPTLSRHTLHGSWAALPLEGNSGTLGAVALSFREDQRFSNDTRERASQLAWQCAQALERALLFDSEQRARERAEAASRAKDEFLAMLGHELRNPLSPILTSLHLMALRDPTGTAREREVIQRQVSHMVRLVDDLLDVSRIASGRIELRKQPVELGTVIKRAIELTTPLIEQKRHRLTLEVPDDAQALIGDQERLVQVFSNLLTNAAKYTPEGGSITVRTAREGADVLVSVIDDGMGISPELLPHVFDLFVQGKRTLARSEGGLGLGLSLVRSLVHLHGGHVSAKSEGQGKGSEFSVRLPLAPQPGSEASPASAPRLPAAGKAQRILLVDDNRDAADSMAQALSQAGHEVQVAYDGPTALLLAQQFTPRLALLDIGLPVMDGYELARRLRATSASSPLTLVAVTGYGQKTDRERSARAGFDRHLVKPVSIAELTEFMAQLS